MTKELMKQIENIPSFIEKTDTPPEFSLDECVLPFVRILQALSKECIKGDAKYLPDSEQGQFYNIATNELISGETGINIIPCYKKHVYSELTEIDGSGKFLGEYDFKDSVVLDSKRVEGKGALITPNGTFLVESYLYYCLNADTLEQIILSFKSTQIPKARRLNSRLMAKLHDKNGDGYRPLHSIKLNISSILERKDTNSWYGYQLGDLMWVNKKQYEAAKNFRDLIDKGLATHNIQNDFSTESDSNENIGDPKI